MESSSRYTISAVTKALKILKLFDEKHRIMSLTELSAQMGINKSSMLRLLESLESEGFVRRIPETKKYKLGTAIYILGSTGYAFTSLKDLAAPIIKKAVEQTGLIGHLGILEDNKALFLSRVWPDVNTEAYAIASSVGGELPIHCTGIGKVLTAFSPADVQEQLLKACRYERYTENTILSEQELREELSRIRRQGYGTNREEHEEFVSCITYPVFNYRGKLIAAVSLTGLTQGIKQKDQQLLHSTLQQAAKELGNEAPL